LILIFIVTAATLHDETSCVFFHTLILMNCCEDFMENIYEFDIFQQQYIHSGTPQYAVVVVSKPSASFETTRYKKH
jgi:hypothetical protein